jgi:orotidine 5'-phosphate decarboxylase subfamily 2
VNSAEGALQFCLSIIRQTHPYAAAFKPNSAFFEAYGADGLRALEAVCEVIAQLNIPIILDVKRGDIDSTAQQYARAAYDLYRADAVTLSPYMGWDSIEPFVSKDYADKAAFILCKTSNPSSKVGFCDSNPS